MKKLLTFMVIVIAMWFVWQQIEKRTVMNTQTNHLTSSPAARTASTTTVDYNGQKYTIYVEKITHPKSLRLIPNFDEKETSEFIKTQHNCKVLTNAGFYTTDNQPLGIFYTQGKWLNQKPHTGTVTNGFVALNNSGELSISKNQPTSANLIFAFQSGPIIIPGVNLRIQNDEPDRRLLMAQTNNEEFFLLAIVKTENAHNGPKLADLPQIIQQYNNRAIEQFNMLINLDGGSASAFITDETHLSEITSVGSFLCEQSTN